MVPVFPIKNKMKKEIRIFFTSLMFFTRIPCPANTDHSADYLNKATRYFPLIGWIVGFLSFAVYWLSSQLFDQNISVILSLMTGVLITGCFHEDGLADVFDGFGGGWTKTKILDIMKDSRIGTYGVVALIFLAGLKFFGLSLLLEKAGDRPAWLICTLFIAYHSLARATAIFIQFTSPYSREDATSKVKPIATSHTYKELVGVVIFGLLPLVLLVSFNWLFILVLLPLSICFMYSRNYFIKWLGGFTGDCLGAVEQIAECVGILSFIIIWKFI